MFREILSYLMTPVPKALKKMGVLSESIAIESRFKRQKKAWKNHLTHCRENILSSARMLNQGQTIMILGSGSLHDVPMDELIKLGLNLQLVDLLHFPHIKRKYKKHPQVSFIVQDVTGMMDNLYNMSAPPVFKEDASAHNAKAAPDLVSIALPPADFFKIHNPDLIISLNLLSQIPLALENHCQKKNIPLPHGFSHDIMMAHINWLKHSSKTCIMISDITRAYYQGEQLSYTEESVPPNIVKNTLPPAAESWKWDIAPKGELDPEISVVYNVALYNMNELL